MMAACTAGKLVMRRNGPGRKAKTTCGAMCGERVCDERMCDERVCDERVYDERVCDERVYDK